MPCNNSRFLSVVFGYIRRCIVCQLNICQMLCYYSFIVLWLVVLLFGGCKAERKWEYEPLSVTAFTSDASQMSLDPKIVQMGRGEIGISIVIEWRYDTTEETMVEVVVYRSSSGDEGDYKLLPFAIPRQPFHDYVNTYFKDVFLKMLAPCSNFPQFEGDLLPPWPQDKYVADKCIFEGEGLPDMLPPGHYKLILNCSGPDQPSWGLAGVFKLTPKLV
ncbi:uncharacterized protein LOC108090328 [Drosophila ficusphila]|uniref:uncharacterized protein LOC108090328 n=1 Tax=Drosophila ficusphila TaxID=30025 RepID=UPI0007E67D31|nr:uncharacterized protein LOC108090328 [Drosophila ficusphila]